MIYKLIQGFFKHHILITLVYFMTLVYIPLKLLGMPHLYGKLISNIKEIKMDTSIKYFSLLILLWAFVQLCKIFSSYIHSKIFPKFSSYIRNNIINTIIDKYKTNYEELQMGDAITKIIKAPWLLEDIFDIVEEFIFNNIIIVISSFFYLFYYNKNLGLIYLVSMILVFILCYVFVNSCKKYVDNSETIYDYTHNEIEDTLSNLMSIYTSQKTKYEKNRLKDFSTKVYKAEQGIYNCNNKYQLIFSAFFIAIFIILNYYSFHIYKNNKIKLDILIAIIIINYSLLTSFMRVYYYSRKLSDIIGRTGVFLSYIEGLPHTSKENKFKLENIKKINIDVKNLTFYYNPKNIVLNNINLKIKQNDVIGLIGSIGSGKSTLGKLLIRLKDPKNGNILLNNVDISKINIDNLRNIIYYIPQQPNLFNRTLFSNIIYGINRKISEKEIYKILDELDVANANNKFKQKMFKKVGKNGSHLSGGQRQLVWLIRCILKDSKVIILDEPTASLDDISKLQIIEFIKKYSKNKIIIIITHDKSLLKYVNRIIELKDGKIIKNK